MSELKDTVWDFPAGTVVAHLHGCACGLACAAPALADDVFMRVLVDLLGDEMPELESGGGYVELARFCAQTLAELDDEDYGFELLLSDEDELGLPDRLTELADWCGGFLLGVGAGVSVGAAVEQDGDGSEPGAVETDGLSPGAREVIDDVVQISRVDVESVLDDRAEFDFFEVAEHLRVGVLTLRVSESGLQSGQESGQDREQQ